MTVRVVPTVCPHCGTRIWPRPMELGDILPRHIWGRDRFSWPSVDKSGKHPYTVNIKGNRQRAAEATYSSPFLTMVYGWDVVKEIK